MQRLEQQQFDRFVEAMNMLVFCIGIIPASMLELADTLLHAISIRARTHREDMSEERIVPSLRPHYDWLTFSKRNRVGTLQMLAICSIRRQLHSNIPAKVAELRNVIPNAIRQLILNDHLFRVPGPLDLEDALAIPVDSLTREERELRDFEMMDYDDPEDGLFGLGDSDVEFIDEGEHEWE